MRCVILQPSYVPWRGYFDLIRRADTFVFLDDVQYDTRGWRNRNRIKTPNGPAWLTIPVKKHGAQTEGIPINAIETADNSWAGRHLSTITHAYRRAPHFDLYRPWLEEAFAHPPRGLSDFTIATTMELTRMLGINDTTFVRSSSLGATGRKTDRLIEILTRLGATTYLSGPSAKDYIEETRFEESRIGLEWMTYDYPPYPQLYPPFDPQVSILDLLLMTGPDAGTYLGPRPSS